MTTVNNIRYCARLEIDVSRWDRCIGDADNGIVYARSFYLDIMAGKWDALVLNDYEAVMPLPWNKKYGFYYLYQPYFIPSLGIFGKKIDESLVLDFLKHIPGKFGYWDIDMNETNNFEHLENQPDLEIKTRTNYHLPLHQSYDEIKSGYGKLCLRMIKKAITHGVMITDDVKPSEAINFYKKHYQQKHLKISSLVYDKLIVSATACFEEGLAKAYIARLPNGEITAAYLVLVDKNFVYFLVGGSTAKGKDTGSFYLITNTVIKDYSGSAKVFRFEGSDIPGIAFFNRQFGAEKISYIHLKRNRLPFPINLFK